MAVKDTCLVVESKVYIQIVRILNKERDRNIRKILRCATEETKTNKSNFLPSYGQPRWMNYDCLSILTVEIYTDKHCKIECGIRFCQSITT